MISAGNDIVALKAINIHRTKQKNFYSKILSGTEQELYHSLQVIDIPFENFVWLLWSIKESAYKYLQRNAIDLVFSPTKIIIQDINLPSGHPPELKGGKLEGLAFDHSFYAGKVIFKSTALYFNSFISNELISTVVNDDESFANIYWGIRGTNNLEPEDQSKEVRLFLLEKLGSFFPDANLKINKNKAGCPLLFNGENEMNIPVSLAHHGCWLAYSFRFIS